MPQPLSPQLEAIRARLEAGEHLGAREAWRQHPGVHRSAVAMKLQCWRQQGEVHIVRYDQPSSGGKPSPVYAWGVGEDARPEAKQSSYERTRRWRETHPREHAEQQSRCWQRQKDLRHVRQQWQQLHKIDPVLSALLGVRA